MIDKSQLPDMHPRPAHPESDESVWDKKVVAPATIPLCVELPAPKLELGIQHINDEKKMQAIRDSLRPQEAVSINTLDQSHTQHTSLVSESGVWNVDSIPSQYQGLPYDLVQEFLPQKMYFDAETQRVQDQRRREILEAVDKQEVLIQNQKLAEFGTRYQELIMSGDPDTQQERQLVFSQCQKEAHQLVQAYFAGEPCLNILPEEKYIIDKIRDTVVQTRMQHPGSTISVRFERKAKELFVNNVQYRIAFELYQKTQTPELVADTSVQYVRDETTSPVTEQYSEFEDDLNVQELESIYGYSRKHTLESQEEYEVSIDKATEVLEQRPAIEKIQNENPTIVISDLHARREFLAHVLSQKDQEGRTVLNLIKEGKINIVCVGDGMHSENASNWQVTGFVYDIDTHIKESTEPLTSNLIEYKCVIESQIGISIADAVRNKDFVRIKRAKNMYPVSPELEEDMRKHLLHAEMVRSFGLMQMVMELKSSYPDAFHFIRGNHDDVEGQISDVTKYADESTDVRNWITQTYGDDFLSKYARFERALPSIITQSNSLVVTHALPDEVLTQDAVLERDTNALKQLMWTENREADRSQRGNKAPITERVVRSNLQNFGLDERAIWVIGHRDVEPQTKFRSQFDGKVIQINDKERELVTVFDPTQEYDAHRSTFDLKSENAKW